MDKFGTHSVRYLRDKRGVTSGFVLNEKRMMLNLVKSTGSGCQQRHLSYIFHTLCVRCAEGWAFGVESLTRCGLSLVEPFWNKD